MRFSTALRPPARRRLEQLGTADLVVGIPCFNNETTLPHVIQSIEGGFAQYYAGRRCVLVVADGGSVDDSREVAESVERGPWAERVVLIYRGIPGKGSAVRAIFEAADLLSAKACLLFDSDLRSITPEWVKIMADAVLDGGVDYVTPYYTRYKYDGTITNNIVYNLTRALYGYRVRQPIGGDFGFSLPLVRHYLPREDWETDVARFGIDIWLTTTAMVYRAKIAQANLGVKIHDTKDPAEALGPMFRQVISTLLALMEEHEAVWKEVGGSQAVPIIGPELSVEPQPFAINLDKLIADFQTGRESFGRAWQEILAPESWQIVERLAGKQGPDFTMDAAEWAQILYDLAAAFHHCQGNRQSLVAMMTPLYFARVAALVNQIAAMDKQQAEAVVEQQAEVFEGMKDYLIERWDEDAAGVSI